MHSKVVVEMHLLYVEFALCLGALLQGNCISNCLQPAVQNVWCQQLPPRPGPDRLADSLNEG
jgi:hypothetical protein